MKPIGDDLIGCLDINVNTLNADGESMLFLAAKNNQLTVVKKVRGA